MKQNVFLISAESEIKKAASLMNRASKAYWRLQSRDSEYGKMLYACYFMMKSIIDVIDSVVDMYKKGTIQYPE